LAIPPGKISLGQSLSEWQSAYVMELRMQEFTNPHVAFGLLVSQQISLGPQSSGPSQ
jgi:hypothetical protein